MTIDETVKYRHTDRYEEKERDKNRERNMQKIEIKKVINKRKVSEMETYIEKVV